MIHLGDWADTTAFRGGARGTQDEAEPVRPDIESGLLFLEEIGCTHAFLGNHEDRIWKFLKSPNALLVEAAESSIDRIETRCRKIGAQLIPYKPTSIEGYRTFGDYKFGHGFLFNENYLRDTAEAIGNSVVAHAHRTGFAKGRTMASAACFGVGTLCRRAEMDYAKNRRATLAWSSGFVWGEYCQSEARLFLMDNDQRQEWRLPI